MALHSTKEINAALGYEIATKDIITLGFAPDKVDIKRATWTSEHVIELAQTLGEKAAALLLLAKHGTLPEAQPMKRKAPKGTATAQPDFEESEL